MIYFLIKGTEILSEGSIKEISIETGRTQDSLRSLFYSTYNMNREKLLSQHNREYLSLIKENDLDKFLDEYRLEKQEWQAYKGENILYTGTLDELAKLLNKTINVMKFYTTPAYQKRAEKGKNRIHLVKL